MAEIARFSGVDRTPQMKCFKPVQKIFVKREFPNLFSVSAPDLYDYHAVKDDEEIRVLLVDSSTGQSTELVPFTELTKLSEIASKHEGFQRRAAYVLNDYDIPIRDGYDFYSILLAQDHAVDLSNDKYIAIEMRNLNAFANKPEVLRPVYSVWGFEYGVVGSFAMKYTPMYLSPTELQKDFVVGVNDLIAIPIDLVREIQFFPKVVDGASPIYTKDELILDQEASNDLTTVPLRSNGVLSIPIDKTHGDQGDRNSVIWGLSFGFKRWAVMPLDLYRSFAIRRDASNQSFDFFLIDVVPTVVSDII